MQIVEFETDGTTRWISVANRDTLVGNYTVGQHDSIHIMWNVGEAQTGTPLSFEASFSGDQLTLTAANGTKLVYSKVE